MQQFTAKISVTKDLAKDMCEKKKRVNVTIDLKGSTDVFDLILHIECAKCQNCSGNVPNSSICNDKGDFVCGGCQCM